MGKRGMSSTEDTSAYTSFPKFPLYTIGAGLGLMLALVAVIRLSDVGTTYTSVAPPLVERELRFEDQTNGALAVLDASNGSVVEMLAPGTNGFVRGALRGLVRERKRNEIGPEVPFLLAARADGRLTLDDPTTNRQIDIKSFGTTHAAVFEKMLPGRAVSANYNASMPVGMTHQSH
jgi:putative photosynthetic complex assembly protein